MFIDSPKNIQFSRRGFIKIMASASLASAGTAFTPTISSAKVANKRSIPIPKFDVKISKMNASKMYQSRRSVTLLPSPFFLSDTVDNR